MRSLAEMSLWLVPAVLMYVAYVLFRRLGTTRRSLERLFTEPADLAERPDGDSVVARVPSSLALPGGLSPTRCVCRVRHGDAPGNRHLGLAAAFAVRGAGLTDELFRNIARLPPGVGDLLVPIAYLAPWTVFLILVLMPWLVIRRSRRQRVEEVEQDLPISLELLATLSEAGLGFDAALSRVLDSVTEDRPLAREFRTYQSDLLAGRTRVESLRRLAHRLEVSSGDDPRFGVGSGGTVGQRHRPSTSPAGRRSARTSPRAGECVCHGAAHQADVSSGDLFHAGHLRLDARPVLRTAFPVCRHVHPRKELLAWLALGVW